MGGQERERETEKIIRKGGGVEEIKRKGRIGKLRVGKRR